jgi:hypothetical protein
MAVGQVGFKDQRKVCSLCSIDLWFVNHSLGQAHTRREEGEPNRQPSQQDQG